MNKMAWLLSALYLLLCLSAKGEDNKPVAVQVEPQDLTGISHSVLAAETWLRTHVLSQYPLTNISAIIAGHTLLCNSHELGFLLPSLQNLHYSLTRWGLQHLIKVTTSFSSDCFDPNSGEKSYRADVGQMYIKPILNFLQETHSPYIVSNPFSHSPTTMSQHSKAIKNLGGFQLDIVGSNEVTLVAFPPRPTPASSAGSPLPPLVGTVSPAPASPPFPPHFAPAAAPPLGAPHLPPCIPPHGGGAPVPAGEHGAVWCVAKPSVPAETLQEALDYACGEGRADCEAIGREGSCYYPDTVVAHASYAFNSYWQKNKRSGGSCGFGGTAMLINSDPSYRNCRFVIT